MTESAWKNVRGANHVEYLRSKTLMCGGTFRSHRGTPHTIGAKRLNLGFFVLMLVVSHIMIIL